MVPTADMPGQVDKEMGDIVVNKFEDAVKKYIIEDLEDSPIKAESKFSDYSTLKASAVVYDDLRWQPKKGRIVLVNGTSHKLSVTASKWPKSVIPGSLSGNVGVTVGGTGVTAGGSSTHVVNNVELRPQVISVESQKSHDFFGDHDGDLGICFTVQKHDTKEQYFQDVQVPFKKRMTIFGEP